MEILSVLSLIVSLVLIFYSVYYFFRIICEIRKSIDLINYRLDKLEEEKPKKFFHYFKLK